MKVKKPPSPPKPLRPRGKSAPLPTRGRRFHGMRTKGHGSSVVDQDESLLQQWELNRGEKDPLIRFKQADEGGEQQQDQDGELDQQSPDDSVASQLMSEGFKKKESKETKAATEATETSEAAKQEGAEATKKSGPPIPTAPPKPKDGFQLNLNRVEELKKAVEAELPPQLELIIPDEPPKPPGNDPIAALNNGQAPGVFFREDGRAPEELDPALLEAVEELKSQIGGLTGIARIFPALDETSASIVIVAVQQGITDVTLGKVPQTARQFPVTLAIPFDLLPIRKERNLPSLQAPDLT